MNAWTEFYQDRLNSEYYAHISRKYGRFISEVKKAIRPGDVVVEFGCGIGNISRALSNLECSLICVDNVNDMLTFSAKNKLQGRAQFILADITKPYFIPGDVAHSHGVLEHLSNRQIQEAIKLQLKQYRELIHYVPGHRYKFPSFGDERLMTPEQWDAICKPDEIIEFNEGYDLILKWRNSNE